MPAFPPLRDLVPSDDTFDGYNQALEEAGFILVYSEEPVYHEYTGEVYFPKTIWIRPDLGHWVHLTADGYTPVVRGAFMTQIGSYRRDEQPLEIIPESRKNIEEVGEEGRRVVYHATLAVFTLDDVIRETVFGTVFSSTTPWKPVPHLNVMKMLGREWFSKEVRPEDEDAVSRAEANGISIVDFDCGRIYSGLSREARVMVGRQSELERCLTHYSRGRQIGIELHGVSHPSPLSTTKHRASTWF